MVFAGFWVNVDKGTGWQDMAGLAWAQFSRSLRDLSQTLEFCRLHLLGMNTVEHIVESYFRLCRNCFTYGDVKVVSGNNRQIDILAVSLTTGEQFHIECSVTHCKQWCPTAEKLISEFERKFSGVPRPKEGRNTDSTKGKNYGVAITGMYQRLGIDEAKINRIWICWTVKDPENLQKHLGRYCVRTGQKVEVISFRDRILPELLKAVSTANYDDEVLRTFSLFKQWDKQTAKK